MQSPNKVTTCILLAGGFGTRLQSVVQEVPKVLAPIANQPFLHYVFTYLQQQEIKTIILAIGYKSEAVKAFAANWVNVFEIIYSLEETPLGTGGAIQLACTKTKEEHVLIINGDTFFPIDLQQLAKLHFSKSPNDLSIALKKLTNFDRYGVVLTDEEHAITAFQEKQPTQEGSINGGIYLLNTNVFEEYQFPLQFSFEKDFMETHLQLLYFYGFEFDSYFIDIGIPSDYLLANEMLPRFL